MLEIEPPFPMPRPITKTSCSHAGTEARLEGLLSGQTAVILDHLLETLVVRRSEWGRCSGLACAQDSGSQFAIADGGKRELVVRTPLREAKRASKCLKTIAVRTGIVRSCAVTGWDSNQLKGSVLTN